MDHCKAPIINYGEGELQNGRGVGATKMGERGKVKFYSYKNEAEKFDPC